MLGIEVDNTVPHFTVPDDQPRTLQDGMEGRVKETFIGLNHILDGASVGIDYQRRPGMPTGLQGINRLIDQMVGVQHIQRYRGEDPVQHQIVHGMVGCHLLITHRDKGLHVTFALLVGDIDRPHVPVGKLVQQAARYFIQAEECFRYA